MSQLDQIITQVSEQKKHKIRAVNPFKKGVYIQYLRLIQQLLRRKEKNRRRGQKRMARAFKKLQVKWSSITCR